MLIDIEVRKLPYYMSENIESEYLIQLYKLNLFNIRNKKMNKLFRIMKWFYDHKFYFVANLIRRIIRLYYSCDIYPTCQIGKGTVFFHQGLGCVIHERVTIGDNCKIYQNVTLGGNGKENQQYPGSPIIEDGVIIYAGACVLGPIRIGTNSIIGANAVVISDVPSDSIAVGVPARVKSKSSDVK